MDLWFLCNQIIALFELLLETYENSDCSYNKNCGFSHLKKLKYIKLTLKV